MLLSYAMQLYTNIVAALCRILLDFSRGLHQFRPESPLFFWSAPRTRTLAKSVDPRPFILKSDWLKIEKSTLHMLKNRTWPEFAFLVLTKRKAGSRSFNTVPHFGGKMQCGNDRVDTL